MPSAAIETPEELLGIVDFSQLEEYTPRPLAPRLTAHAKAPLFCDEVDGVWVLREDAYETFDDILALVEQASEAGVHELTDPWVREAYRQAGFVSLTFFLRVICSVTGPYDKLTDHLHVDMANFYQYAYEIKGSKAFGTIGRGHFKSSIWTHGGVLWKITRDPELECGLASATMDRVEEFLHIMQSVILDNALYRALYPEHVPENPRTLPGWNDSQLTLPSKRRNRRTPNVILITACGASAGIHVDDLQLDDIISEQQLDSQHGSSADMARYTAWLKTGIRTLVKDWKNSRVFGCGTRYAVDDAYQHIFENAKAAFGYWEELDEDVVENGEWLVYHRTMVENNRIVFPEAFTKDALGKLDRWTAATQYWNNPKLAGSSELVNYRIKDAGVEWVEDFGWVVTYDTGRDGIKTVPLSRLDVKAALDPAASERRTSAATSRTAIPVAAMDENGNVIFLEVKAGYVPTSGMLNWIFEGYTKWLWSGFLLEQQGPFKLLGPILRDAEMERQVYVRKLGVPAIGKKDDRIRAAWDPLLAKGKIFATKQAKAAIMLELKGFPMAKGKDVLDAGALLIRNLRRPYSVEEVERAEAQDARRLASVNKRTGV